MKTELLIVTEMCKMSCHHCPYANTTEYSNNISNIEIETEHIMNEFNIKSKPKSYSQSYYMRAAIHDKLREYAKAIFKSIKKTFSVLKNAFSL